MEQGPIRSQQEYNRAFTALVHQTAETLKISSDEAARRVSALYTTDILVGGSPDDPYYQMRIDLFLQIPSRKHKYHLPFLLQSQPYQAALLESVNTSKLVTEYERLSGDSLGILPGETMLTQDQWNEAIDFTTGKLTGALSRFEKFFRDTIWIRFKGTHEN